MGGNGILKDNKYIYNTEDMEIPFTVNINKRLKYMRVTIDMAGMMVSAPYAVKNDKIQELLKSKSKWIYEHYKKLQNMRVNEYINEWVSGEKVKYRGEYYLINVFDIKGIGVRIRFDGSLFEVYTGRDLIGQDRIDIIKAAFRKLYIKIAGDRIKERLVYYSELLGVKYNNVRIKEQKTRWGSCSKKGNLNFNWKLIIAPDWILDYIVVHELCHLLFLNHSREFWNLVGEYMHEYKAARIWLKDNYNSLNI